MRLPEVEKRLPFKFFQAEIRCESLIIVRFTLILLILADTFSLYMISNGLGKTYTSPIPLIKATFDIPSVSNVDIVAANVETVGTNIIDLAISGNAIFYALLTEGFFSLWAENPKEVESLIKSVVPWKFKFKKNNSLHSFRDDNAC
ncbi:hypothetical protein HAX54_042016 [Datura stramonium]|uniref:Uncharacterized protein n=1 Tax=Datura stramonium TaxID=4076 RepID=A0ABS8Y9L7_DATST|nr:hypothetical protein [Datura stramonium]